MKDIIHLKSLTNLPLSSNQKRLWIVYQQDKLNPAYNISQTYFLKGKINPEVLKNSLEELFTRQYTMFSVFKENAGEPYIEIKQRPVTLEIIDFSHLPLNTREEAIIEFAGKDSRRCFDIEKGPLFRLCLLKQDEISHYFHFTVHHIIFDAGSWKLFLQELSRIYNNLDRNIAEKLEPLLYQSYDFAAYEEKSEIAKDEKSFVEFWKENLRDCPGELKFPYDYPRKTFTTGLGHSVPISISPESTGRLKELCSKSNTSLFKTLLTVLGVLLRKYSGENDICIGFPVSTRRTHPYLENLFGFYINTTVARLKIEDDLNFRKLLIYAKDVVNNAIDNSRLPFDRIVEVVNPERRSNISPLFQIAMSWVSNIFVALDLNGVAGEKINIPEGVSPSDITFYLWEDGNNIKGVLEYNTDLLEQDTMIRLRDNFIQLVENLIQSPDAPLHTIQVTTKNELNKIIGFTRSLNAYPKDKTIVDLFEEMATLYPQKTAVVFKKESITYGQLNSRANQLARTLRDNGVLKNTPVGILAEKSLDIIIGILGILKSGGAYVPIDTGYPLNRINFIIKDSGCKVLVAQDKFMNLPVENVSMLSLNSKETFRTDKSDVEKINSSDDLAYILYTSGTTGNPKGTQIPQKGVVRLVRNTNYIELTANDRMLMAAAIVFDASTFEIWGALLNGGTLYIIDKETLLNIKALEAELIYNNITTAAFTSSLFTQIAEISTDIFHNLKYLLIGGDVLSARHINKVRKDNPQLTVTNGYGPTENSCMSTYYKIERNFENNIPIGKPVSNSTAYVFDKYLNYQPVGVIGELYVGGDGLAKGYINREDLNRTSFLVHPHIPGERLYRTGDYARWLADGNLEFHGRVDNQLKIRGYRVELEEIETVISEIGGVIETVVKPVKVEEGDYKLIAFLNVQEGFKIDSREIVSLIKSKLPSYMIPSAYKFMYGFPKTVNGKIDRKALVFDIKELESKEKKNEETLTPTQRIIHNIWSEALKVSDISATDNFFDIGGNSLLAVRLINIYKEKIGYELTFKDFTTYPTIGQSGKYIDSQYKGKSSEIKLIHLTKTTNLPLTRNQKRLWLISKFQPDMPSYIISFSYKFSGSLNLEIFHKSLNILFIRHHIVFSVIKEINGEPYCDIVPSKVDFSVIDYSGQPGNEKEKENKVIDIIAGDSRKAFDLKNGPLYRMYLIKTAGSEYYFHLSIHHIIFDGWSWSVLVNDLNEIYNGLLEGKDFDLKELDFQLYDYAHWEESSDNSEIENESKEFWRENLKEASPLLNFPYDFQMREQASGRGGYEDLRISPDLSEKLRLISKNEGSSLFAALMAVFSIQLYKYSGDNDISIGVPLAYRPHSKLENIFGMFVNTVVVRLRFTKELTFRDIIHRTSEAALNAIAHQDLTFEKVVEIVNPKRTYNTNPLFQVAFAWQNNLDKPINLDGINCQKITVKERTIPFDLLLSLYENDGIIEGEIGYSMDLLKNESIVRLRNNFLNLINTLVENPDSAIDSLSIISEEEKKIIDGFNDTQTDYPKDKTVAEVFEDQANLYPGKIAAVFQGKSLTYKQLNKKANSLARTLRAAGVRDNIPVGILAEKSLEMIIGLLAILKAGGGYVPIDPDYPQQRINFIISDSGIKIMLTQNKFIKAGVKGVIIIDLGSPSSYKLNTSNLKKISKSSDLAYIMYTSGTTGIPKGSMILQHGVVRLVRNTNYIELTAEDRILLTGAIVFDATTFEIWGTLLNGGTLFIVEKETILNLKALDSELKKNRITVLWLTSALFTQIAEARPDIFSMLKYLLVGGDVLSAPHINKVRNANPRLKIINGYGPTENTTFSTTFLIDRDYEYNIPIGKPISNSTAYIFDNDLNYQPIGVIGELYVGGDGVSKGYINREDLNKESFINSSYNRGERLYKTGDYARWLQDGNIEFHGRIDNQLKIRGFRVELEEIESVISEIDGVIETVIKPIKIKEGDLRLSAFLNVSDTFSMNTAEISRKIKEKLPHYMVPSVIKIMNGFPKTINGKTDKNALTSDDYDLILKESLDLESFTMTELEIYKIWSEILKTKDISAKDNFFELGGNSLMAISVYSQIESVFKIELGLRVFFDSPRIKDLGEVIDIIIRKRTKGVTDEITDLKTINIINGEI